MEPKELLDRAMDELDRRWPDDGELATGDYLRGALAELSGLELEQIQEAVKDKSLEVGRRAWRGLVDHREGQVSDGHLAALFSLGALEGFVVGLQYARLAAMRGQES